MEIILQENHMFITFLLIHIIINNKSNSRVTIKNLKILLNKALREIKVTKDFSHYIN